MKNYCKWFLSQPVHLFNYNAFLLQQGINPYKLEIRKLVLVEIDDYILSLYNTKNSVMLDCPVEFLRRDLVLLYIVLLNKNYFNNKSPNYYSELLLAESRRLLNLKGTTCIYPSYRFKDWTACLLHKMHYFITDDSHRYVTLRKDIFGKDYILPSSALERAKLYRNKIY